LDDKRSIGGAKDQLLEIISTVVLLANVVVVVVDLSRVFHAVDSATLQVTHRCTPAPYGTLAALPTQTTTTALDANSLKSQYQHLIGSLEGQDNNTKALDA